MTDETWAEFRARCEANPFGFWLDKTDPRIVRVIDLPDEVQEELQEDCPGNDTGRLINPEYNPIFKAWLEENGHDATRSYIGWWSW